MPKTRLGHIRLNWRGVYTSSSTYNKNDIVSYNSSNYICVDDSVVNVTPTDSSSKWDLMSVGTNALTTKGDLHFYDGSNHSRLPIGREGQALTVGTSGVPIWGKGATTKIFTKQTGVVFAKKSDGSYPSAYSGNWRGYPNTPSGSRVRVGHTLNFNGFTATVDKFDADRDDAGHPFRGDHWYVGSSLDGVLEFTTSKPVPFTGFSCNMVGYDSGDDPVLTLEYYDSSTWNIVSTLTFTGNRSMTNSPTKFVGTHTKWRIRFKNRNSSVWTTTLNLMLHPSVSKTNPFPNDDGSTASSTSLTVSNTHDYKATYPRSVPSDYWIGYPNPFNTSVSSSTVYNFTGFTATTTKFDTTNNENPWNDRTESGANGHHWAYHASGTGYFEFTTSKAVPFSGLSIKGDSNAPQTAELFAEVGGSWQRIVNMTSIPTNKRTTLNTSSTVKATKWRIKITPRNSTYMTVEGIRLCINVSAEYSTNPFPNTLNSTVESALISDNAITPNILVDAGQKIRETHWDGSDLSQTEYTVNAGDTFKKTVPSNGAYWYELIE